MNFFDRLITWMDRVELSGITLATKIVIVLVPYPVANQTRLHAITHLGYTDTQAWILAAIVEIFGYAAMYKALQFAEYNRKYTDVKRKAPLFWAVIIYIFYLAVVIVFNVIPEIEMGKPAYIIWMNLLVAMMSVPAGALAGVSAIHTERKEAGRRTSGTPASGTTSETRLSKPLLKVTSRTPASRTPASRTTSGTGLQPIGFQKPQTSETKTGRPSIHQDRVYEYMEQVYKDQNRVASFAEVERDLELPQSTASRLRNSWVDKNAKGEQ